MALAARTPIGRGGGNRFRPSLRFAGWVLFLSAATASSAGAEQAAPPVLERFAAAAPTAEAPDFQKHVVPLLGKLGCNGRACHGSFQGRGGFRLSLFGYDFNMDYPALTKGTGDAGQVRVDLKEPRRSLILRKPTLAEDHEGGFRFSPDGWEHRLLERWIAGGARGVAAAAELSRLEVEPAEIVFARPDQRTTLRVVAVWQDGSREDVTCLCRFQVNDPSVADLGADAEVVARGPGDTHVVVFYDNGVTAIPVLLPIARQPEAAAPQIAAPTRIDELVGDKLRKLGIEPSDLCTDAEFLRRVSVDMTGTLPMPAEVEAFLADSAPDKRVRKIDQLLASPAYAAWWANKLCDFTGNNPFRQGDGQIGQFVALRWYQWIQRRIAENVPYDELVAGIVVASGRQPGQSYAEYCEEMTAYFRTNEPADFSARPTMPLYWARANLKLPEDRALDLAHSFLGLRLQCAQCHKHPYDQWTQGDFKAFAALFGGISFGVAPQSQGEYRQVAQAVGELNRGAAGSPITREIFSKAEQGRAIPWREVYLSQTPAGSLKVLGQRLPPLAPGEDVRAAVMQWMRAKDNPYFARAFVNRVWANYFHAGLVEPVDDMNRANPATNEPLLDYLAQSFLASGFDMRGLHRQIAISHTYQRSWRPNDTNAADTRNYSRAIPRRIPAEVVYDALTQSTAAEALQGHVRADLSRRAIGQLSLMMTGTYAMRVFGKPDRAIACDCERTNSPSLLQAIFLQNDPILHGRVQQGPWLDEIQAQADSPGAPLPRLRQQWVRQAYLRTVSRPPTPQEEQRALAYLDESKTVREGISDLVWALVNSKEFILNH